MAEQGSQPHQPKAILNLIDLEPGMRVRLPDDATAEVILNPRDGIWLQVRYLTSPRDPGQVGTETMVFADDVIGLEV
jgi:hypothetical protein